MVREANRGAWRLLGILAPGALGAVLLPGAAFADVLQIGEAGPQWVAGGPAHIDPLDGPGQSTGEQSGDRAVSVGFVGSPGPVAVAATPGTIDEAAGFTGDVAPQSITAALDAAGPTKWRERVARLAAKYDISPQLLEAVVWQESRWNELAVSPVGARGLAQLMPGTAAQMGINSADPHANLEGGARYLRMQLDAFDGNIEKALAAYNAGPARVTAAGGIPNIRETKAYVASIMARLTDPVRQ